MQPDNGIWSVNRIYQEKYIFQKSCRNEAGRQVPDLSLFFQKALFKVKASGLQVGFIKF